MFVASAHNYLLLFTNTGRCHWLRVFEIPEGSKQSKGRAAQNILSIPPEDQINAFIKVEDLKNEEYLDSHYVVMATKKGILKKTLLRAYSRPRVNGINAITVKDGDELLGAAMTNGSSEIIMASRYGYVVRFDEEQARPLGRTASGVRGQKLRADDDALLGLVCVDSNAEEQPQLLVVSMKGYGKRSELEEYRKINRGGKGVKTMNITEKTGKLISIKAVTDLDDLMIIGKSGITIRMSLDNIRVMGRATQGVRLIKISEDDEIAAVAKVEKEEIEEIEEIEIVDETTKNETPSSENEEKENEDNNEEE